MIAQRIIAIRAGGILLLLIGWGCVSQTGHRPEPIETTLIVARAGNKATLNWKTKPGILYTVLYADRKDATAVWKRLAGATNIAGTGGMIEFVDHVSYDEPRHYRLEIVPLTR